MNETNHRAGKGLLVGKKLLADPTPYPTPLTTYCLSLERIFGVLWGEKIPTKIRIKKIGEA